MLQPSLGWLLTARTPQAEDGTGINLEEGKAGGRPRRFYGSLD